jgi:predicted ATPase/DNA-binding SARP family transcriptional activator
MGFEFRILGPLDVIRDGVSLPISAPKLRVLLVSLLVDANQVVTVDTLASRLWNEVPPEGARNTLQNYVLRLRRSLGCVRDPDLVATRTGGYQISIDHDMLDLARFSQLTAAARSSAAAGDALQASTLLREALGLWRAQPLSDIPSEQLQRDIAAALTEKRLDAIELKIDAELELGLHTDVLHELRELTNMNPLRERFWAQRMLALYRSGRQGEALECYRTIGGLLIDELGVGPGTELRKLHHQMLNEDPALEPSAARAGVARTAEVGVSCAMTRLVGRDTQLAQAHRLLELVRLVTLTGTAGVGKTRLVQEVVASSHSRYRDGVCVIDLGQLDDPDQITGAVADALHVRDLSTPSVGPQAADHLRDKAMLIVLDNCEHMVGAAAELAMKLLRAAPGVRVLAASRQRLGVPGEHVLVVSPLTDKEAVELLVDRATAAAPGFQVTERNRHAVERLCQRLDGIPLAIEFAAARLVMLSPGELCDRLNDGFHLLTWNGVQSTRECHRSLFDAIDLSYRLCSDRERSLWARLSVFRSCFDLEAAEVTASGNGISRQEIIDLLAGLVHKSILSADIGTDRAQYHLPEASRWYGQRRLGESGLNVVGRGHRRPTPVTAA